MRKLDRKKNDVAFPRLYYPELYLLEGGYKAFYEQYPVSFVGQCHALGFGGLGSLLPLPLSEGGWIHFSSTLLGWMELGSIFPAHCCGGCGCKP